MMRATFRTTRPPSGFYARAPNVSRTTLLALGRPRPNPALSLANTASTLSFPRAASSSSGSGLVPVPAVSLRGGAAEGARPWLQCSSRLLLGGRGATFQCQSILRGPTSDRHGVRALPRDFCAFQWCLLRAYRLWYDLGGAETQRMILLSFSSGWCAHQPMMALWAGLTDARTRVVICPWRAFSARRPRARRSWKNEWIFEPVFGNPPPPLGRSSVKRVQTGLPVMTIKPFDLFFPCAAIANPAMGLHLKGAPWPRKSATCSNDRACSLFSPTSPTARCFPAISG